jgi:hypothetical protein
MHSRSALRSAVLALALAGVPASAWAQKGERPPPPPDSVVPQRILKVFPFDTTWMAVNLNGKAFASDRRPAFILDNNFAAAASAVATRFLQQPTPCRIVLLSARSP